MAMRMECKKAIAKGDLKVINGMYFWHRDIHEHITGGKDTMQFGGGEPHAMTLEEKEKMMEFLNYAPWAKWGATPNNIPVAELKKKLSSQTQMQCKKHKTAWMPARQCAY